MTPGAGWLNVRAPTTPGYYTMTCAFDGYGNYAPSTSGAVGAYISAFNQIGGIKLYTNPTTYNPYKSCVVYIVFQAAPGGPTPTGNTSLTIGRNYTASVDIASNGTLSVRLNPLPLPEGANQITVDYSGDAYYRWASSTFSFTNPAIPSNAPPSSGSINSSGGGKAGSPQPPLLRRRQEPRVARHLHPLARTRERSLVQFRLVGRESTALDWLRCVGSWARGRWPCPGRKGAARETKAQRSLPGAAQYRVATIPG